LVRALPSHGRGQRFKSFVAHHNPLILALNSVANQKLGMRVLNRWLHHSVKRARVGATVLVMTSILRTIEFLALSVWLGSDVFLSFVVAPGAFRVLAPNRDQAGAVVGFALTRMHLGGIVLGIVFLLVRLVRTRSFASFVTPAALCVVLMIALTAISQYMVSARMAVLRVQMGSIQATTADSPLLAEFGRLHTISVTLESGVLLAGIAAVYLMVRELATR
jgi:hypothetical protein